MSYVVYSAYMTDLHICELLELRREEIKQSSFSMHCGLVCEQQCDFRFDLFFSFSFSFSFANNQIISNLLTKTC